MNNVHDQKINMSVTRGALVGGIGFGLASLLVFATVAFGERWMHQHLTPAGAYIVLRLHADERLATNAKNTELR